jgi:Domain of unknown function (DUF4397)
VTRRGVHTGRRSRSLAGLAAATAVAAAAIGVPAQASTAETTRAAGRTAEVSVVHGIPGAKVKVCIDGAPAIRRFTYGEKVVRRALPAGRHGVRVVPTGRRCQSPAILRRHYVLEANKSYTLVASLKPSGTPSLRAFGNRVRPTKPGRARLTVRHLAQAPAVNVWAGSTRLIGGRGFTWGDRQSLQVPHGSYRVKVTLPGKKAPVIGPRRLTLRAGNAYQVHAVGKAGRYRLVVVRTHVGTH